MGGNKKKSASRAKLITMAVRINAWGRASLRDRVLRAVDHITEWLIEDEGPRLSDSGREHRARVILCKFA